MDKQKKEATSGTAAIIKEEIGLLEYRIHHIQKESTNPSIRQRILIDLESRRCSLQSLLQQT